MEIDQPCCICGGTDYTVSLSDVPDNSGLSNGRYDIICCDACGHCRTWPFPDLEKSDEYYPTKYRQHNTPSMSFKKQVKYALKRQCHKQTEFNDHDKMLPFKNRLLGEPVCVAGESILDVGCGNGEYLLFGKSCGWDVAGVEPASTPVENLMAAGIKVVEGRAEAIPYKDSSFDVVRAWHSMEHTESPLQAFNEVYRVLKPGGYFLLSVPNFGCAQRQILGKYWPALEVPRHLQHFTSRSLDTALRKSGFTKIQDNLYPGVPFFDVKWRMHIFRGQGFSELTSLKLLSQSLIKEAVARCSPKKEVNVFLTWWLKKEE